MSMYSGDAAEQVVRMTLEGGEFAIRMAGSGAKQLAILLYAVLKDQKRTKGKIRLTNMLKSGKELKVFAVQDRDLQKFCSEAKKYGVLYTVLKDRDATDGLTDIMVRAEDASKINRIFERFQLATVDMGSVKAQLEQERSDKARTEESQKPPEKTMTAKDKTDEFLEKVLQKEPAKEEQQTENPTEGRIAKSRQSEPSSKKKSPIVRDGSDSREERSRPSVKKELEEIRKEQKEKAAGGKERNPQRPLEHRAPKRKPRARRKGSR